MHYIFVHGLGQNADSWGQVISALHMDVEVETPNIFALCAGEMDYRNLYKAFSAYCDQREGHIAICGLSLGGVLGLHYAIEHPQKIASLVLIGTQYQMPKHWMAVQNLIFQLMPQKAFLSLGMTKKDVISLTKSMMDLDFSRGLREISCPVLLLCGEKDRVNLRASRELDARLSRSALEMIPGAGHEVNTDNPLEMGEAIGRFFKNQVR